MTVDEFKQFIDFVIRKSQSGSNPTPDQFNIAMARGYTAWINKKLGVSQEYQPGVPIVQDGPQVTIKVSSDLEYLMENREFWVDSFGHMLKPDGVAVLDSSNQIAPNVLYPSTLRYNYITTVDEVSTQKQVPIEIMRDFEFGYADSSAVSPPTKRFPICTFYDTYIEFRPRNIGRVRYVYYRVGTVPKWGFKLDSNGRPEYDANTSVQIESPDNTHDDIVWKVMKYLAISIREPEMVAYTEQFQAKGD